MKLEYSCRDYIEVMQELMDAILVAFDETGKDTLNYQVVTLIKNITIGIISECTAVFTGFA